MNLMLPFASKDLPDGRKLYRRKHGYSTNCAASADTDLVVSVPYDAAKINEIEIIGCPVGTKIDLKVLDTPTGTVSTYANYMLNQFGFDVRMPADFYRDHSQYDADVIKDMQIKITIKNTTADAFDAFINIVFHEIK